MNPTSSVSSNDNDEGTSAHIESSLSTKDRIQESVARNGNTAADAARRSLLVAYALEALYSHEPTYKLRHNSLGTTGGARDYLNTLLAPLQAKSEAVHFFLK